MPTTTDNTLDAETSAPVQRKPYVKPTLADLGSVAEITHGAAGVGGDIGIYS